MSAGRVLFVTVGTTALTAEHLGEEWEPERDSREALIADIKTYLSNPEGRSHQVEQLFPRVLNAHRALWDSVIKNGKSLAGRMEQTSAEMTSTYLLTHTTAACDPFDADKDIFVLLSSVTSEGRFCARVNARLLHEYLFSPTCGCKASLSGEQPCEHARVEIVTGLEAKTFTPTVSASVFSILDQYSRDRDPSCNITGGYKGTIPAITAWAKNRDHVSLFYQYMSSDSTVTLKFLPGRDEPKESQFPALPAGGKVGR